MNEPTDPIAEIIPSISVRLVADTARAEAARASMSAVHDMATPTITPSPMINISEPVAAIVTPIPAA